LRKVSGVGDSPGMREVDDPAMKAIDLGRGSKEMPKRF